MDSNSAPPSNPMPNFQPWYPSFRNVVITNERRPGRYTKREKRMLRARLLPVLPNPDDGKDYVLGGKYAKTPEQVDAEFAEQLKVEEAMREEEKRRMGMHYAVMTTSMVGGGSAASSSNVEEGANGGNGGGAGVGRGGGFMRFSNGGMRGIGRRILPGQ